MVFESCDEPSKKPISFPLQTDGRLFVLYEHMGCVCDLRVGSLPHRIDVVVDITGGRHCTRDRFDIGTDCQRMTGSILYLLFLILGLRFSV